MDFVKEHYNNCDEDGRLLTRHGSVEYITTMKYIHECLALAGDGRILEIGAGTGRYSIALAREGYPVTAVELVPHNIEVLKSKLDGTEPIEVHEGDALDLSFLRDESYDVTLLLGPMYHLFTKEDKLRALSEALRVTRKGGYLLVAYCMNEATIIQYCFMKGALGRVLADDMLEPDWHCRSEPSEIFELVRTEDIAELDAAIGAERIKLVATDGASHYFRAMLEAMDEATFEKWVEYHLATCERQDLVGASNHTLDILRKNDGKQS